MYVPGSATHDELGTYVPRELNFVNEGHNAEAIGRFFKHRDDVAVPRIHWELTTRRVLVMDFVEGIKITDVEGLRAASLDPEQTADIRAAWQTGTPLGNERFREQIEAALKKKVGYMRRGRPSTRGCKETH